MPRPPAKPHPTLPHRTESGSLKGKGGRPPVYTEDQAGTMQDRINDYFADCDRRDVAYTVPGLCLWLGFEDRHAMQEYEDKGEFSSIVKRARQAMEAQRVEQLLSGKGHPVGKIFDLKCNFGYREADAGQGGEVTVKIKLDKD